MSLNLTNEGDYTYYTATGNFVNKAWEEAKKTRLMPLT
jgi:hypothetical protein